MTHTYKTTPHYLKFPDQQTWKDLWTACSLSTEDGYPIYRCHIVELGEIHRGGEWDEEGNVIVAPETLDGWHVNILLENELTLPEELAEYAITKPNAPAMVWSSEVQ